MSSRGAFGAPYQKHKSQNVNSVYSGKNTAASKASGPSKHGGLQALGRTTTIVRRMPKPATLPSLKAEHGQDPHVCLVPQGSQGWLKSSAEQPNNADSKTLDGSALPTPANGPDLRPNWAKQSSPVGTPPSGGSAAATAAPGGGGSDGSAAHQPSAGGGGGSGEYPTLAAAMKFGAAAGSGHEPLVSLPNVIPPQPAGYIGASGPRVSDRKLPSRYYGGPESSGPRSATGQKKYDFMQKMAKLSLDSNKEPPVAAHASSEEADVKSVHQQMNDSQPPNKQLSDSRAHPYGHHQQSGFDRQRLSASESTTDSSVHHNKHRPPSFEGFGGGGSAEPEDVYHPHIQQPSHHAGHPKHNADGLLPQGERPSGRGDTGFSSQSTDIQQHQNPPSAGRHVAGSFVGRDGYDGVGGGGGGYRYGHSGSFHHSESGSYDNNDEQLYRGGQRHPAGFSHEDSGWPGADDLVGKPPHQRPTRQPLLSQPQSQPQQQQIQYRVDSRHTNNSDSDGNGWNASIGNFSTSTGRRGGNGGSCSSNGMYPSQHQSSGWYSGGNGGGNSYPPSLMSLETGAMESGYDGRYNRQQPAGHSGGYGSYGGGPRNGPVTGAYAQHSMDEQQQFSTDSGHAAPKSVGGRRAIGAELSSASEGDPSAHGYLSNDFFGREHGGDFENEKGLWERSYGGEPSYSKRSNNEQQPQQPPIRMLKRNDEKSAEYFAYYATPNPNPIGQSADASSAPANAGTAADSNAELPSYSNVKKPLLVHKSKAVEEMNVFEGGQPSSGGYREFHRRESQPTMHSKKGAVDTAGQNFGGGTTVNPSAGNSQSQQKFNRAPGGGKSQQNQQPQQQQGQQRNGAKQQASDGATAGKAAASNVNLTAGPPTAAPPVPSENVWEKRKEERLQAERKGLTARQRRQLDQHFPPMSEAAKIEAAAAEMPAPVNSGFIRDMPRNQDVRLEQKGGFGNLGANSGGTSARGFPQWNPPAMNAESHWDEALKPTATANSRRRNNNNNHNNNGEPRQRNSETGPQLGANYGTRREFVNSKNRAGPLSANIGGNNGIRGVRNSKPRGGTTTVGRSGDSQPRQSAESASGPSVKPSSETGEQQLLKAPADVEQDNFSNMGEFHAEDYKIESSDRTKGGQRVKNSTGKPKIDKDGRTRRGPLAKRHGEGPIRRHSRQECGGNFQPNESTENGDSNAMPNESENPTGTESGGGQSGRQLRTGGQRLANPRRVGASRTGTAIHQTRGLASGGLRAGQRPLRSNAAGGAVNRPRGGDRPLPPSTEAAGEPTLPAADSQQNRSANGCASLADRSTQLKSPVISDGGQEEWETASESSDFGRADHQPKASARNSAERDSANSKPNGAAIANGSRAVGNRQINHSNGDFVDGGGSATSEASRGPQAHPKTAGQKNVKPASHMFQSNADSVNKNNNKKNNNNSNNNNTKNNKRLADGNPRGTRITATLSHEKIARDCRKGAPSFPVHDGLAGVDINDASVVVIDHHPDLYNNGAGSSESAAGDFEEVLSKKAKRQRLQQLEAERRRLEREKERQDKLQAKRIKQLQRRAERSAAKKATESKKETPPSDCVTVFTNQNYLGIGIEVFGQTADEKCKETADIKNGTVPTEQFLSQPSKSSPGDASLGAISTGLDDITMTTVWNSTLAGISSADGPASGPPVSGVIESLTKSVIPSPIARPAPKNGRPPTSSNTWSSDGLTASNKTLETAEKFDFTFDPALKGSLKGSSVDGGLDSAEQIPLAAKSRYDSMRRSCSPGRGGISADAPAALNGGLSVLSDLKSANSSSLIENSDHAQLQKKLDRVKDFWPGALSSNGFTSAADVVGDVTARRLNVAKVKPQPVAASMATSTVGGADSRSMNPIHPLSPIGNKPLSAKDYGGFSGANISLADYNSLNGFIPMSSATSQSPSAAFGLSTGLQTIPPYQIMFRNGEFLTQPAFAHSANSPPTQNIIGQSSGGIIGTQQRSSRPNSFIEHTLIMAQQPNGVPTTPWSTGGGFEFLNGINATPPPPIAASTSGSGVGRSSIPPMAPPPAIGPVIGHHTYGAPPPPPPPQLAMVGQAPGKIAQAVNYGADYGIGEPMINFAGHHPHGMPPSVQMAHHLSHAARMAPPLAAGNPFGGPPPHRGAKPTLINGVPPPPPSMSVPPPPTHLPPPPYFPPPPPAALRMAHIPPPPPAVNWSKQPIQRNTFLIDQYRAANSFDATRVPQDFSAPPPPLNGAAFVGHTFGGEYRAPVAGGRNGAVEKIRPPAERKISSAKNGADGNETSAEPSEAKPRGADVAAPEEA